MEKKEAGEGLAKEMPKVAKKVIREIITLRIRIVRSELPAADLLKAGKKAAEPASKGK